MLMSCCAYSCTQYGLHTQYMFLTKADDLLCLVLPSVNSRLFFTNLRFSFEQTLYISFTLLKYTFLFILSLSVSAISRHTFRFLTHTIEFNLCAMKFPRPSGCEAATKVSSALSVCFIYQVCP